MTGTSGLYAKEKKLLEKSIYKREDISFHDNDFKNKNTFKIIKKDNLVWSLEGPSQQVLVGSYVKTEFLNVKLITLLPFQKTHVFKFDNNTSYLSLDDNIVVNINNNQECKLSKKDGLYIPNNNEFTLENKNDYNVEIILCEGL